MTRAYQYRRLRRSRRNAAVRGGRRSLVVAIAMPLILVVIAIGLGLAAGATSYYHDVTAGIAPPRQAIAQLGGGAKIYDRNGTLLYEFLDPNYGYQDPVTLDQVSPYIQQATVAAEDASFYSNPGVNVKGLTRAAVENLKPGDGFLQGTGGSSITQQLVKQIYFTAQQRSERSVSRKVREAVIALQLTHDYDKSQILTWYLNQVPYGGVLTGIESASEGYLGVPAKDVTLAQAAFLAGLPQSPAAYDPFTHFDAARRRQGEVLDLMVEHGYISQEMANWAMLERIKLNPRPRPFLAPHFVNYVADYIRATLGENALIHGGLSVVTTLDLKLNNEANTILESNIEKYEASSHGHNGAVVIMSPSNGQILAMVGSRDYNRADVDGQVNAALALRSPGSTLKPFTYVTAYEQGWSPDWPIVDTPISYSIPGNPTFVPINPDKRSHGVIPLKVALGNSFNVPAFKTILWVGVDNMINTAKAMGITTLDGHQLGPAVTLGGSDVKLADMVYGYSVFANGGVMAGEPTTQSLPAGNRALDPIPVLFATDGTGKVVMNNTHPRTKTIIKPEYAWLMSDTLSNDANRVITYGAGSNLNIPGWQVAVKTGTSQPYENSTNIGDTWTFGYTPDVAVGVWVGNSDNTPMVNIFSTTIAGATWHDVMADALKPYTPHGFVRPPGIVTATVCVPSGILPPPGSTCPTVTGLFAADALARQNDSWWGGQTIATAMPVAQRIATIPPDVTGYKRYLANEYVASYHGPPPPRPAIPTPTPPPIAPPPAPPPPAPTAIQPREAPVPFFVPPAPAPRRRGRGR
jgi:membrane peptidoglycan carboxypeptidase